MKVSLRLAAVLALSLCAASVSQPAFAAQRGITLPAGVITGVSVPGGAAAIPAISSIGSIPSIPSLPTSVLPGVPASVPGGALALGVHLSGAAPVAAASGPAAPAARAAAPASPQGVRRPGAPGARAALTRLAAAESGKSGPSAAPLSRAFDGSFEKGSLEEALVAPAPAADGRVDLDRLDTAWTGGMKKKKALKKLSKDQVKLDALQQVLYADHSRKVLVVLQAMDTGGKDGTIRHVMRSLNPQGVTVASFKKPTAQEQKHHYLWRIKKALGGPGMITIFNRSHYEDILAPTIYRTFDPAVIEKRYEEINRFEKKLTDEGWTVLKIFLHISKDEQKRRLQARLDEPDKNWKFSPEDLKSRARWGEFQGVYEKILARTNTPYAPWFVIPADNKWFRDYAVGRLLKRALKRLDLHYPAPAPNLPKTIPD